MNNQNATLNTTSSDLDNWDYLASVRRIAARKLGTDGLTVAHCNLNRAKLQASALADLRNNHPQVFPRNEQTGRPEPLPTEYYNKVISAVDDFIKEAFKAFTDDPDGLGTVKTVYKHHSRGDNRGVMKQTIITRNELMTLKDQIFKIDLFISKSKAAIEKMETGKEQILAGSPQEKKYENLKKRIGLERETKAVLQVRMDNLPKA